MRRAFWPTLLGIMLILSGIFCLFSPVSSSTVIPYMIGIALTATGIGKLIRVADTAVIHGYDSGRSDRLLDYDYGNTSDRTCFSAAEGDRICGYFWPTGQQ